VSLSCTWRCGMTVERCRNEDCRSKNTVILASLLAVGFLAYPGNCSYAQDGKENKGTAAGKEYEAFRKRADEIIKRSVSKDDKVRDKAESDWKTLIGDVQAWAKKHKIKPEDHVMTHDLTHDEKRQAPSRRRYLGHQSCPGWFQVQKTFKDPFT